MLTIAARVATQVAMIRVAQGSVAGLVRNLCGRILTLPLEAFEAHDAGALTAVLTEDVVALTAALSGVPLLVINLTVFLGCFVYLASSRGRSWSARWSSRSRRSSRTSS